LETAAAATSIQSGESQMHRTRRRKKLNQSADRRHQSYSMDEANLAAQTATNRPSNLSLHPIPTVPIMHGIREGFNRSIWCTRSLRDRGRGLPPGRKKRICVAECPPDLSTPTLPDRDVRRSAKPYIGRRNQSKYALRGSFKCGFFADHGSSRQRLAASL